MHRRWLRHYKRGDAWIARVLVGRHWLTVRCRCSWWRRWRAVVMESVS